MALVAIPCVSQFVLADPVTFNGQLTFELYTTRAYELDEDVLECYVDYSQTYLQFRRTDGQTHGLTKTDKVYLENFDVPGGYSMNDQSRPTHKSFVYRVSPLDLYSFKLMIPSSGLSASINRPGDPTLGKYSTPVVCTVAGQIVTTPIPHGF